MQLSVLLFLTTVQGTAFAQFWDPNLEWNSVEKHFSDSRSFLEWGDYRVRRVRNDEDELWYAQLSHRGKVVRRFGYGMFDHLVRFAMIPIVSNGSKQLVIETRSGGSHCCTSHWVYELGEKPVVLFNSERYDGDGLSLMDLDSNGTSELVLFVPRASENSLDASYLLICSYDSSAREFLPANAKFRTYFERRIRKATRKLWKISDLARADTVKDTYQQFRRDYEELVLDIFYMNLLLGEKERAWAFFEKNYTSHRKEVLRREIKTWLRNDDAFKENQKQTGH